MLNPKMENRMRRIGAERTPRGWVWALDVDVANILDVFQDGTYEWKVGDVEGKGEVATHYELDAVVKEFMMAVGRGGKERHERMGVSPRTQD